MEYPWISCSEVAGIKIDKKRWRELIELQKEEFPDTAQEWGRNNLLVWAEHPPQKKRVCIHDKRNANHTPYNRPYHNSCPVQQSHTHIPLNPKTNTAYGSLDIGIKTAFFNILIVVLSNLAIKGNTKTTSYIYIY